MYVKSNIIQTNKFYHIYIIMSIIITHNKTKAHSFSVSLECQKTMIFMRRGVGGDRKDPQIRA